MPFRFRKSIKLFPGVRINLSKSGVSTSLGVPGATVNVKPGRKSKATVGIPGSGISYSAPIDDTATSARSSGLGVVGWLCIAAVVYALFRLVF